jgi:hypothetical protein
MRFCDDDKGREFPRRVAIDPEMVQDNPGLLFNLGNINPLPERGSRNVQADRIITH